MPALSVITVCLNNKRGLERTINSVIRQSFQDFEFLVIDGNSTDGSVDVIKENSDRITYWVSEKDNGIYHAMNKGIAKATGDYLLFLNSGDYLYNDEVLQSVFSKPMQEDIIYGSMYFSNRNKLTYASQPETIRIFDLIFGSLYHPATFIRRKLFEKTDGYDEAFKIAGDYDFFVKALINLNVSSRHIPVTISVFTEDGISNDLKQKHIEKQERDIVIGRYFTETQIADARKYYLLVHRFSFRVVNFLERKMGLTGLTKRIFHFNYY